MFGAVVDYFVMYVHIIISGYHKLYYWLSDINKSGCFYMILYYKFSGAYTMKQNQQEH